MDAVKTLSGSAPIRMVYQAGTTISNAGIPVIGSSADAATDLGSVEPMTASGALTAGNAGLCMDTATVAATGQTSADIAVTVLVNPDLIVRARMNNGATSGTALSIGTTTAASTDGSVATGVTTIDNGIIWPYDGANSLQGKLTPGYRRTDDASGSVTIAFDNPIASGDRFLAATGYPCASGNAGGAFLDLTTDLTEAVATTEVTDTDNFIIFDVELRDVGGDGENTSFYHLIANQHIFGSSSFS